MINAIITMENYFPLFHSFSVLKKSFISMEEGETIRAEVKKLSESEKIDDKRKTALMVSKLLIDTVFIRFEKNYFRLSVMGVHRVTLFSIEFYKSENLKIVPIGYVGNEEIILNLEQFNLVFEYLNQIKLKKSEKTKTSEQNLEMRITKENELSLKIGKKKALIIAESMAESMVSPSLDNLNQIAYPYEVHFYKYSLFIRLMKEIRGLSTTVKWEVGNRRDSYRLKLSEKGLSKSIGEIYNELEITKDNNEINVEGDDGKIEDFYGIDFIKNFLQKLFLPPESAKYEKQHITIFLKKDHPLKIEFIHDDYSYSIISYQAPRIQKRREMNGVQSSEEKRDEWSSTEKQLDLLSFL